MGVVVRCGGNSGVGRVGDCVGGNGGGGGCGVGVGIMEVEVGVSILFLDANVVSSLLCKYCSYATHMYDCHLVPPPPPAPSSPCDATTQQPPSPYF